jgi:predicted O-methyltransferase YrrM
MLPTQMQEASNEAEDVQGPDAILASHDAELLRVLAESSMARSVVEVQALHPELPLGGPKAESTRVLCEAMRKTGGQLVSIIPSRDPQSERQARAQVVSVASSLEEAGLLKSARFVTGDVLEQIAALTAPIDLLFISGEIDYAAVFHAAMPKLRPGSLVVAHRARAEQAFLNAIHADLDFETTVLEHGAGLSVSLRRR